MKKHLMLILLLGTSFLTYSQSLEDMVTKAFSYQENGHLDSAIYTFDLAIKKYPNLPMLYVLKGELLGKTNRRLTSDQSTYGKAIKQFDKAIELDPTFFPAYSSRGLLNIFHQKFNLAVEDFSNAYKYAVEPEDKFNVLADLGSAKLYAKDYDGAIAVYDEALKIKPNEIGIYINMATLQMNLKQYDKAEQTFMKAIAVDDSNATLLNNIALMYSDLERYDEAIEKLEKALSINSEDPYALNNLGFVKIKAGKAEEGLKLINKSLSIYADNSYAFKNRAIALIALGKTEDACNDLTKANQLGYSNTYDEEVNNLIASNCK